MSTISEAHALAAAVNLFARGKRHELSKIHVVKEKRLFAFSGPGWKVLFIFAEENCFLNDSLLIEVDETGAAEIFLTM